MKNSFLEGKNIYLRALAYDDLDGNYINWLNDKEVCKHNSHHIFPYTKEKGESYIKSISNNPRQLVLAVVSKEDDVHIGNISLQNINLLYRNAEFAILMGEKNYWGKGYGKEAGRLIINHGFNALNLRRIYCGTFEGNIGMDKLAMALKFKREGERRKAAYKNGKFINILEYGLLREEFEG